MPSLNLEAFSQEWPYRLAKILDPHVPFESKVDLVRQFLSASDCCCDKGFSIPLQQFMKDRGSFGVAV